MTVKNLNQFANALAMYARKKLDTMNRGALLIRCIGDGSMIAAVFGNDNYLSDDKVRREVELVRLQLREEMLDEVGFGLSYDGHSWTLLVQANAQRYQTAAGKAFQIELLKIALEDMVWRSWWSVCGLPPDSPERTVPPLRPTVNGVIQKLHD